MGVVMVMCGCGHGVCGCLKQFVLQCSLVLNSYLVHTCYSPFMYLTIATTSFYADQCIGAGHQ